MSDRWSIQRRVGGFSVPRIKGPFRLIESDYSVLSAISIGVTASALVTSFLRLKSADLLPLFRMAISFPWMPLRTRLSWRSLRKNSNEDVNCGRHRLLRSAVVHSISMSRLWKMLAWDALRMRKKVYGILVRSIELLLLATDHKSTCVEDILQLNTVVPTQDGFPRITNTQR